MIKLMISFYSLNLLANMYHLYDKNKSRIIWSGQTPYDAKPSVLPDSIVELVDVYEEPPKDLQPYEVPESYQEIDLVGQAIRHKYRISRQIPEEIPLWAFRSALGLAGIKNNVINLIDSLPEPQKSIALEQWEYGNFILRNHPLIISLSAKLGLSTEEVDQIFITANSLT